MKTLDQIWDVYLEKGGKIDETYIRALSWHIEHDGNPDEAISMAEDMIMESQSPLIKNILIPEIAKQLHNEDEDIRESAVGAIRRLIVPQYGQEVYDLASKDVDNTVKIIATRGLGDLMREVDKSLAQKMAIHLYDILINDDFEKYNKRNRDSASDAVLSAMDYDSLAFSRAWNDPDFDPIWKEFCKKYKLEYKPVFRR